MSYDIELQINTGKQMVTVVHVGKYTSNVAPMWQLALSVFNLSLDELDGWTGEEALPVLETAVNHMRTHREEYLPLHPKTGWGDFVGARDFLMKLLLECEQHPLCTISIEC